MAAAASHRAITQAPTQQVTRHTLNTAAMVMHDRALDITGAATIGVGPWLPVRLSGFLAVPPRLPPLQGITAAPMAATPHLAMAATPHLAMAATPHLAMAATPHLAMAGRDATHTTVAKPGRGPSSALASCRSSSRRLLG